jgi:hypothetical protein
MLLELKKEKTCGYRAFKTLSLSESSGIQLGKYGGRLGLPGDSPGAC